MTINGTLSRAQDNVPTSLKAFHKPADTPIPECAKMCMDALSAKYGGFWMKELKPWIFLSYGQPDKEKVEHLYQRLSEAGFRPWMATKNILPGEDWEYRIEKAIQDSSFFLACLSTKSVNRRGHLQKEIREALEKWKEMLREDIYLIPVKLEECVMPDNLCGLWAANPSEENGWKRLLQAITEGMRRRGELSEDSLPVVEELTPSNLPTPTSIAVESHKYTAIVTLTWDYVQGEIPADRFVIFQSRGTPLTYSDSSSVISATSRAFMLTLSAEIRYRFGIAAAKGPNLGPIIQPNSLPDWEI